MTGWQFKGTAWQEGSFRVNPNVISKIKCAKQNTSKLSVVYKRKVSLQDVLERAHKTIVKLDPPAAFCIALQMIASTMEHRGTSSRRREVCTGYRPQPQRSQSASDLQKNG